MERGEAWREERREERSERERVRIATERKMRERRKTSKEEGEQLGEEGDCFTGDMIILCSRVI